MAKMKTVLINRDGKKVIINKIDYDPEQHLLWGEKPEPDGDDDDDDDGGKKPEPDDDDDGKKPEPDEILDDGSDGDGSDGDGDDPASVPDPSTEKAPKLDSDSVSDVDPLLDTKKKRKKKDSTGKTRRVRKNSE